MKHLMGLGFATLLGIVAAGLNWVWLAGLARPDNFVGVKSVIEAGTEIGDDDLVSVPVPGDREELRKSLVPWEDRAILFGVKASRNYREGDVVLHRDLKTPTEESHWDVIGPFKLISVGERFKDRRDDDLESTRTDGNNLTIAVDAKFDERTKRLLQVIAPNASATDEPKIVAVQVLPSNQSRVTPKSTAPQDIVYQTVSLEGIANVPRVLLAGDMIRFVIPARPRY